MATSILEVSTANTIAVTNVEPSALRRYCPYKSGRQTIRHPRPDARAGDTLRFGQTWVLTSQYIVLLTRTIVNILEFHDARTQEIECICINTGNWSPSATSTSIYDRIKFQRITARIPGRTRMPPGTIPRRLSTGAYRRPYRTRDVNRAVGEDTVDLHGIHRKMICLRRDFCVSNSASFVRHVY